MVLKELIFFLQFLLWEVLAVLKDLLLSLFTLRGYGGLERTGFQQFPLWEDAVFRKD